LVFCFSISAIDLALLKPGFDALITADLLK